MHIKFTHVLVGLLIAAPLASSFPSEKLSTREDLSLDLDEGVDDSWGDETLYEEEVKRRDLWKLLAARGKPGEKPPPTKKPSTSPGLNPNKGPDEDPETIPGLLPKPAFSDNNLERARAKGAAVSTSLDDAIFKNSPEPELKVLSKLGYTLGKSSKAPGSGASADRLYMEDFNIDSRGPNWQKMVVFRGQPGSGSKRDTPILDTRNDCTQKAIVVKQSWKSRDEAPPKMSWTDMVHESWIRANSHPKLGGDPKELKFVVRDNIQYHPMVDSRGIELNTPGAIDAVFEKLNADKSKTLTIIAKSDDPNMKASYELLAAQTHVSRILQWFTDRHIELGNLKIAKLHVTKQGEHPSGQYTIIIETGH